MLTDDPFGEGFVERLENKEAFENIVIDKTDHLYQCDGATLDPLGLEMIIFIAYLTKGTLNLKTDNIIPSQKKVCVNQYFYAFWLLFLEKNGLAAEGMDLNKIKAVIDDHKGDKTGDFGYIYKNSSDFYNSHYFKKGAKKD